MKVDEFRKQLSLITYKQFIEKLIAKRSTEMYRFPKELGSDLLKAIQKVRNAEFDELVRRHDKLKSVFTVPTLLRQDAYLQRFWLQTAVEAFDATEKALSDIIFYRDPEEEEALLDAALDESGEEFLRVLDSQGDAQALREEALSKSIFERTGMRILPNRPRFWTEGIDDILGSTPLLVFNWISSCFAYLVVSSPDWCEFTEIGKKSFFSRSYARSAVCPSCGFSGLHMAEQEFVRYLRETLGGQECPKDQYYPLICRFCGREFPYEGPR